MVIYEQRDGKTWQQTVDEIAKYAEERKGWELLIAGSKYLKKPKPRKMLMIMMMKVKHFRVRKES